MLLALLRALSYLEPAPTPRGRRTMTITPICTRGRRSPKGRSHSPKGTQGVDTPAFSLRPALVLR